MNHVPWILRAQGVPASGETPSDEREPADDRPSGKRVVAGVVATVNLIDGTCTTTEGDVIRLGPRTAEVAEALTRGARVQIDAEGVTTPEGLLVTEVWVRPE